MAIGRLGIEWVIIGVGCNGLVAMDFGSGFFGCRGVGCWVWGVGSEGLGGRGEVWGDRGEVRRVNCYV
jgi:hypothetical protein